MSAPELISGYVVGGKYVVRSLLLHGGATATYRAVGPKNREVAVKLYDPAILSFPDVLKALALHRSVGAKLSPQQVLPIAESGTDSNSGAPFTVSDFDSGPSLAQLIDAGPLSAADMLALVRNLARATDLLHSSGVTSLSLHPGNVFVRPNAQYETRIADFGATLIRTALPVPEKAGRWMPWLAPEQIKGQAAPPHTADVFAIGLIAFFAVTGKPYWRSSQAKVKDAAALRREILGERMPASVRASEYSITLNSAVDTVFARALAFRPADRYATAGEFAAGLEAAISGRPVTAADARPQPTNVAAATAKTGVVEPATPRGSSPDDTGARRMAAPAPRKMAPRATMLGMGSPPPEVPIDPAAVVPGARPPLTTMMGIGESGAQFSPPTPAKAFAPAAAAPVKASPPAMTTPQAKASPPAMPTQPAKASPPAMPTPQAKAAPPAMPAGPKSPPAAAQAPLLASPVIAVAPAQYAAPATTVATPIAAAMSPASPVVVPSAKTTTQRGGPPPLPMAPPPAQMDEVLARFEAGPPGGLLETASPAFSVAGSDVAQSPPAWSTAEHGDALKERVETGVAVLGADFAETPKRSRLRWIASICGVLVLTGGAALALSGGTSGSPGHAASEAKATTIETAAPSPAAPPPAASAAAIEEPQTAEPAAPAAAPPPTAEPAAPVVDSNAAAQPEIAPSRSTASPNSAPPAAPAAPPAQPSKKPCGKFLKRCY